MLRTLKKFSVDYLQILDENGKCDEKLKPKIDNKTLRKIYELMVLTRVFDEKAVKLLRGGRLGTYAAVKGQEASQVGAGLLMQSGDLAFPAFREHCLFLSRGFPMHELLMYWGGDERGMMNAKKYGLFPVSVPVGSHPVHAVGVGMAFNYLKKKSVSLVFFGDGATSEGDFHEAMNFAGVFKTPTVFFCQNNQYAISVPRREQTASETLAQKAIAYGFQGIQVDGNDVFAMYKVTMDAMKKARAGKGPTFIECFTYRLGDHTTSDDAKKYRKEKEVEVWEKKGPILRLEKYMLRKKIVSKEYFDETKAKAMKQVSDAVAKYEATPLAKPEEIFNYLYESMPKDLQEQKAAFKSTLSSS